jgi:hypothetical protein
VFSLIIEVQPLGFVKDFLIKQVEKSAARKEKTRKSRA